MDRTTDTTAWTPEQWHAYITSAPNLTDATDRIEEAVNAGADFAALTRLPRMTRRATAGPVSARSVPAWVVRARGFTSSLAHDLAQERAARWIASAPFAPVERRPA